MKIKSSNSLIIINSNYVSKINHQSQDALFEIKISNMFNHPNIIKILDLDLTLEGEIELKMPRYWGDAYAYSTQISYGKPEILNLCTCLYSALEHIHSKQIIHRDLHPGNVFINLNPLTCVLGDFGFATKKTWFMQAQGCFGYIAPEIVHSNKIIGQDGIPYCHYDEKVDVFAAGAVMAFLFFKHHWNRNYSMDILNYPRNSFFAKLKCISPSFPFMMHINPKKRWSAKKCLVRLLEQNHIS